MDFRGKTIDRIFFNSEEVSHNRPRVPPPDKLMNFEFRIGDPLWLYLDPYGDEELLPEFRDRV